MGRKARPWYRESRGEWCINYRGKLVRLGKDQAKAFTKFAAMLRSEPAKILPDSDCTFAELANAFLRWVKIERSPATFKWYSMFLDKFAAALQPETLACEVLPADVEAWLASNPDWKTNTRIAAIRSIKTCYRWATQPGRDILARNPVAILKVGKVVSREHTLTDAQRKAVLAAGDAIFRDVAAFMLATGCRPQEVRAIEARQIRGDTITLQPAGGNKRKRQIYMTPEAAAIANRLAKQNPTGPIFRNINGDPLSNVTLYKRFGAVARKLKLPWLCAYVLRHTWATDALANGVDVATVAELMGNSIATVMMHYGHLAGRRDYLREQARKAVGS